MSWTCQNCETQNPTEALTCEVCAAERTAEYLWKCPYCETVNPSFFDNCEVCGVEKESTAIVPVANVSSAVVYHGDYTPPLWQVPGLLKVTTLKKVKTEKALAEIKRTDDPLGDLIVKPIERKVAAIMASPASVKKKYILRGLIAVGVGILVGLKTLFPPFLIASIASLFLYNGNRKIKAWIDKGLEPKLLSASGYEEREVVEEKHETGHSYGIVSLSFSAKDDQLISIDERGYLARWVVATGEKTKAYRFISTRFDKVEVGVTSAYLFDAGMLSIHTPDGRTIKSFPTTLAADSSSPMVLSPRKDLLCIGSNRGGILVMDLRTYKPFYLESGFKEVISSIDFFPESDLLLTGTANGTANIWDLIARHSVFVDIRPETSITAVAVNSFGTSFAVAYMDSMIRIFSRSSQQEIGRFMLWEGLPDPDMAGFAIRMLFVPGKNQLLTVNQVGVVFKWDWLREDSKLVDTYSSSIDNVTAMTISNDGKWLVLGGSTGLMSIFDLNTSKLTGTAV